jgi:pimeloyl-ACP methyl ester carboxylesterase
MNDTSKGNYAEVNGLEMCYEVHGSGQALILLHGGVGAIEMFGEVLGLLAEGRQVVAVDLQAHGRTGIVGSTMLKRAATLDDVGNVAAFAASDHARTMTATALNISCGAIVD